MKWMIIQHPPFWEYDTLQFNANNWLGCIQQCITMTRSMNSLGWEFLDFLDQASWCHLGMAGSSWLHRCGMGYHRHWYRSIPLNSWCGGNSWGLVHLGCQCCSAAGVGCMCCAGGGSAGCSTEKQCLVGACGVAVVPLGTVSTTLTLCSWRCLCMQQNVGPLLVHTW